MVILDKARALDRVVTLAIRIVVPDGLARAAPADYDTADSDRSATPVPLHAMESWGAEEVASIRPADEQPPAEPVPAAA